MVEPEQKTIAASIASLVSAVVKLQTIASVSVHVAHQYATANTDFIPSPFSTCKGLDCASTSDLQKSW